MFDDAIRKADALVEALPYIRLFKGKTFVIKFGGSAMDDPKVMDDVLEDVVFLAAVGVRPVFVHGGGPHISAAMKKSGLEPEFVAGHRKTDKDTLEIAIEVLAGQISAMIARRIEALGGSAVCSFGPDGSMLKAEKRFLELEAPDGSVEKHDLGYVGRVTEVETETFSRLGAEGRIVVVPPIAQGRQGQFYNVNADSAASAIALKVGAEKLVMLTNVPGIIVNKEKPDEVASSLSEGQVENLIKAGVIHGGMLPKVAACLAAVSNGVAKAHIIDAATNHAILLEIFTDKGIGTQIVR